MKSKICLILLAFLPFISSAKDAKCAPRKSELLKYSCPAYVKNKDVSSVGIQDGWMPEGFTLSSKNYLRNIDISYGNDFEPSKEGMLIGSDGTTKLNHGYSVYRPYKEAGKWASNQSFYLQCSYKNPDLVLYKKISKEMRACDVYFKKSKNLPLKKSPTGTVVCSTAENYIIKFDEPNDCRIGQSVTE
jgi:hypothetical protein